jgi:hypothetical protein
MLRRARARFKKLRTRRTTAAHEEVRFPIYADGTLAGRFQRKNTGEIEWGDARRVAAAWELVGDWQPESRSTTAPAIVEPSAPPINSAPPRRAFTIRAATDAYLANREARQIRESTLRKYRTSTKQILAFAAAKGYERIDQSSSRSISTSSMRVGATAYARRPRSWSGSRASSASASSANGFRRIRPKT